MRFKLFLLLLFISSLTYGQLVKDIFPLDRQFKRWGYYVAPELNYLVAPGTSSFDLTEGEKNYVFNVEGSGKIGYGLELGAFYSFKNLIFIDYIELGLGYREFKGSAIHEGIFNDSIHYYSENTLDVPFLQGSVRITNVSQLGKHSILTNSFGVNTNYSFSEKYIRSNPYPLQFENFLSNPNIQIHYQLGFGFRVSKYLLVIPSVETPLINVFKFDGLKSGLKFFSHGYQPVIFKIRFLILQKDPVNCNAPRFEGPQPGF